MAKNNKKTLILNTLILLFCIVIIALYSLIPLKGKETKKFLLTFDSDGGTAVAALDITECEVVTKPVNPTKEGYIFVGWELNGEPFDFSEEICGDMELKAIWEEMSPEKEYITIYLQYGTGDPSPVVVEKGTIPPMPQTPTRDGYNFVEWHVNGFYYGFDTPLEDGTVVEAIWEEVVVEPDPQEDKEYTVVFNPNGGYLKGNCDNQTVKSGGTAATGCSAERDEYTFLGWNTNKSAKSAQNLKNVKITKNTTFYAIWKANSSSGGGGSSGGGDTPTPTITYNLSCSVGGSNTYTGTTTNNSTAAAATECNKHKGNSYNLNLYTIKFETSSCSLSGTSLSCSTNASAKSFIITCKEVYNTNNGKTNTCIATSNAGAGATIKLDGNNYPGVAIPNSMVTHNWGICFGNDCAADSNVTARYSE